MPHVIELFVADHCPGCPDARRRVEEFARSRTDLVVVERRVEQDQAAARQYGLIATPAIVIDGTAVLYGTPTVAQLAAQCDRSDLLTARPTSPTSRPRIGRQGGSTG